MIGKAICEKYFPIEDWERDYGLKTSTIRRICKYSNLNLNEVLDLPYSMYLLLSKESWIDSYMSRKEGMEILKNLWRLQQTEADIEKIRQYEGK